MATFGSLVSGMSSGTDVVAEFTTAATLATTLASQDDASEMVPIGFTFPFYGTNYGNTYINTNGLITFDAGCLEFENMAIPDANNECDGYIAPFWDDLDPGSAGDIYFGTSGSAPNRTFIVEWRGVAFFTDDSSTGSSALFNLILYEGSGDVEFQYGPMSSLTTGIDTGGSATIGFENQAADRGLEVSFDTENVVVPGRAMRFAYGGGNFVRIR